jgi:putative ABC transport system substrate-binding protein
MNRRETLACLLGAAIFGGSRPVLAQSAPPRRIGFLMGYAEGDRQARAAVGAFQEGMQDIGLIEGRDFQIEYRWAGGDAEKARAFARELLAQKVDLIIASTNQVVSIAMQEITSIPIVFVFIGDPLGSRFADTLTRPGRNLTGFANFEAPIGGKWLELLKELSPQTRRVGFVYHPGAPPHVEFLQVSQATAPSFGLELTPLPVTNSAEIEQRISAFGAESDNAGIVVPPHALTLSQRGLIVGLAARHRLAGIYGDRYFAESGGLLSFGINLPDQLRRAAKYVDVIFKGAKPADLPVQLPVKYELTVNLKTAKELGIAVPSTLLVRADEVIE